MKSFQFRLLDGVRLVGVTAGFFLAATFLGLGNREARAELSWCFHECDGLECEFNLIPWIQCDEEEIEGESQCTNFPCNPAPN